MRKEIEGILVRENGQPCIRTEDGKTLIVYNLFDGLSGKKVRITVEELVEDSEEGGR